MLQSQNTAFPRQQIKKRWGTDHEKVNATYETTDKQTEKNFDRGNLLRTIIDCVGVNDTSTHVGHFVSSPREREKIDRRESRRDEREDREERGTGMKVKNQKN